MTRRFESQRTAATRAFTLIEVLVVVAIIALLIAILLPSLRRARIQAQNILCAANAKTISLNVAYYQGDFKDYVPIMRNWHATHHFFPNELVPAEQSYLSLALRRYEHGLANLANIRANQTHPNEPSEFFNPLLPWSTIKRDDYEARLMPEHYACPFERGRDPWERAEVGVQTFPGGPSFRLMEWTGAMDSYHTWYHEGRIIRGRPVEGGSGWGGSPDNGIAQYSVLTWNSKDPPFDENKNNPEPRRLERHRHWSTSDVARLRGGTLGEMTIIFCVMGEHMELGNCWFHRGSHPTPRGGGTYAVFADMSVRWVRGTRIGWP